MKKTPIRLFITGGTIDDIDIVKREVHVKKESYILRMLKQARVTYPVRVEKLTLKDSREMTGSDRELILKKVKKSSEYKIIITHGTFTMEKTARFLEKRVKNKVIVLTGSMIPFKKAHSDALFNLGCAMIAVQTLSKGVYIIMNGNIFSWNNVRKNLKKDIFETLK